MNPSKYMRDQEHVRPPSIFRTSHEAHSIYDRKGHGGGSAQAEDNMHTQRGEAYHPLDTPCDTDTPSSSGRSSGSAYEVADLEEQTHLVLHGDHPSDHYTATSGRITRPSITLQEAFHRATEGSYTAHDDNDDEQQI